MSASMSTLGASTGEGLHEWDELPLDGSEAWLGMMLMAASSVISLKFLCWTVTFVSHTLMR